MMQARNVTVQRPILLFSGFGGAAGAGGGLGATGAASATLVWFVSAPVPATATFVFTSGSPVMMLVATGALDAAAVRFVSLGAGAFVSGTSTAAGAVASTFGFSVSKSLPKL